MCKLECKQQHATMREQAKETPANFRVACRESGVYRLASEV